MEQPLLHVALIHPEIPQNTGNIGRLCVGIGARLHLVRPLGFSLDAKAVRRSGIDHWRKVDLQVHEDLDAFQVWSVGHRLHRLSRHASESIGHAHFERGDVLIFGCESQGLPPELRRGPDCWRLPVPGPIRSLNLSNAVAVVAYRAMEQIEPESFVAALPR